MASARLAVDEAVESAQSSGIRYDTDSVTVSCYADMVPDAVIRITDCCEVYRMVADDCREEIQDAARRIRSIADHDGADVAMLRYIKCETWRSIDTTLCHGTDYSRKLLDRCMPEIYDAMPNEWRTRIPRADG